MTSKEINELWQDFIDIDTNDNNNINMTKLRLLVDDIIKYDSSALSPKIISFISSKNYHANNDRKVIYLLKIIENTKDPKLAPYLLKMMNDKNLSFCKEDICHALANFSHLTIVKDFLKKNLNDKIIGYRCAINLGNVGDYNAENKLIELLKASIDNNSIHEEILNSLLILKSPKLWEDLEDYLKNIRKVKEVYKIFNIIKKYKVKETIPLLFIIYDFFKNVNIEELQDLKTIDMEKSYVLTRAFKKTGNVKENLLSSIVQSLTNLNHYKEVKEFLQKIKN